MTTPRIRPFTPVDTESVVALWQDAGLTRPWNDPYRDIERKLTVQPELFLVATDRGRVCGTVMAGYDGHRGWLYYLAVDRALEANGIGRRLVEEAEERLSAMGCPKVQLMVRPENARARVLRGPGIRPLRHLGHRQAAHRRRFDPRPPVDWRYVAHDLVHQGSRDGE